MGIRGRLKHSTDARSPAGSAVSFAVGEHPRLQRAPGNANVLQRLQRDLRPVCKTWMPTWGVPRKAQGPKGRLHVQRPEALTCLKDQEACTADSLNVDCSKCMGQCLSKEGCEKPVTMAGCEDGEMQCKEQA